MPRARIDVVLDTHTWIWWALGVPISAEARAAIDEAASSGRVHVPAICVWEVAMLVSRGRLTLAAPLREWVERALALPGFDLAPLRPDIAIESCALPGELHGDPVDRLVVATARLLDATLVTRDAKLLAYATAGHVAALAA